MSPARWYCPPGVPRPAHALTPLVCRMTDTGAPVGAVPGGTCYGGPLEPGELGWHQHADGHWFDLRGASPLQMIRLDPHPRLIEWRTVAGADPSHIWRVPVLVSPTFDEAEPDRVTGFKSSLDRVWNGQDWTLSQPLVDLRQRLLWTFQEIAGDRVNLDSADAVDMALSLLDQGQAFDRSEIIAAGWVTEVLVVRVLCAGSDRDIG